jgi:ubiquinone/menaquinone biosynthesis C-methylase UbiE
MKGHRWFAVVYDLLTAWGEAHLLGAYRRHIVGEATGRVLEIGAGTGASFPYYDTARRIVATEPDPFMLARAQRRARSLDRPIALVQCPAETLPFADASFDTVVSTLVLCTVEDQDRSLAEIRRVLKPGGSLRFIEHVRFDDARGRVQDAVLPVWRCVAAGCHPNRRTAEMIQRAGFQIVEMQQRVTPLMPLIVGAARHDAGST